MENDRRKLLLNVVDLLQAVLLCGVANIQIAKYWNYVVISQSPEKHLRSSSQ